MVLPFVFTRWSLAVSRVASHHSDRYRGADRFMRTQRHVITFAATHPANISQVDGSNDVKTRLLKPRKAINTSECACGCSSLTNHRSVSAALALNMF
ncbi:hypothetical protein M404DRAFT_1009225 [Pisolithus tinctorius Marx 270]|uniref:Uncharacterized protein n=1 Tax=Pisolithus tinctorius Marx 270 TaxID=870435 RepID=A0A0C3I783_PISTI|nr:hypothetical protein M404DRAFT_1009225 [Pisolithus tinctorius Marx 270]